MRNSRSLAPVRDAAERLCCTAAAASASMMGSVGRLALAVEAAAAAPVDLVAAAEWLVWEPTDWLVEAAAVAAAASVDSLLAVDWLPEDWLLVALLEAALLPVSADMVSLSLAPVDVSENESERVDG